MTDNATSTDQSLSEAQASTDVAGTRPSRIQGVLRWGWPVLYVVTFGAMIWWYEFRAVHAGSRGLQGTWRAVTGAPPDERYVDSFLSIDGDEKWFVYDRYGEWSVQHNRISLRPAENFFVVRRTFGFDYGRPDETEHFIYLKNDTLYEIRGLADLDPMNKDEIRKLRRTDSLPDEVRTAIRDYVERVSKKQRDEAGAPRP